LSPNDLGSIERRSLLIGIVQSITLLQAPNVATASDVKQPNEFKNVSTQAPAPEGENPFVTLPNGVKIKDFRIGSGDEVKSDSTVQIQASGRLLNLNGEVFYNTKNNNPDGFGAIPLTIKLNNGEAVPGLEAGLIGMKKGGIRRIIVPPDLAYSKFPNLEPRPMNANDQRTLDSVVKNPRRDATILFDVSVERFK
jgi:FKBP-type peptidyl-prolyl cis-trans isomerase